MKELVLALVKAQSEFLTIVKGEKAEILTKSGARFSYQYANLETCIEQTKAGLNNNGLAVLQTFGFKDGKTTLITTLWHISGQSIVGEQLLECVDPKDPQKIGSVVTYLRRYGYMAILGLAAEDDDGNTASQQKPVKQAEKAVEQAKSPAQASSIDAQKPLEDKTKIKGELCDKKSEKRTKADKSTYTIHIYTISSDGGASCEDITSFANVPCEVGQTLIFGQVTEGYGVNKGKLSAKTVKVLTKDDSDDIPF